MRLRGGRFAAPGAPIGNTRFAVSTGVIGKMSGCRVGKVEARRAGPGGADEEIAGFAMSLPVVLNAKAGGDHARRVRL